MKNHYLDTGIGRMIEIEGKEYLYFSGTSYLGIGQDDDFLDILSDNLYLGSNHGQSRINNIRLRVFDNFESHFAQNAGSEAAAVLSSGYLAGIAAWKSLHQNQDEVWIAPDAHPAVTPDNCVAEAQFNFTQWKKACLERSEALSSRKILIIGNAVDPFKAEIHKYDFVKEISNKHEVSLLVDDSHAFGTFGKSIFGTYSELADLAEQVVVSGSLGKGLGLPAGIILGTESHIEKIKSTPLFGGASPGSPAHLQTFIDMEFRYLEQKQWLDDLCGIFALETANIPQMKGSRNFPAFVYSEDSWVKEMEKAGIITSSFHYPTASSPRINRIVLSAYHELGDIKYLNNIIQDLSSQ